MSTGTTVQVIGAVVDVEFPAGQIPKVYDAYRVNPDRLILGPAKGSFRSSEGGIPEILNRPRSSGSQRSA